jgi:RNA polymerase I specific transcription initiation factor
MSSLSPTLSIEKPNIDCIIPNSNSDSDSLALSPTRPNRWTGAPSTWAAITSHERGLAASLDSIRNSDLSIHLYNSYALKKRARDVPDGKIEEVFSYLPEEDRLWEPPRYWTAWPLRPEDVPREGEKVGPEDPDEEYTFRKGEEQMPSRVLEDVLVGTTLRFAKERFTRRENAGENEQVVLGGDEEESGNLGAEKIEPTGREVGEASEAFGRDGNTEEIPQSAPDQEEVAETVIKEVSQNPQPEILLKPVVSADDERSRELLRPSIRHTLSRLDEVLMALHYARMPCRQFSQSEPNSDNETPTADENPTTPVKRPKGRPRKFANLPDRSRNQTELMLDTDLFRAKKTHRGRPQKVYERLEGESQQDYLVRIARIQKKPLPYFAPPREARKVLETERSGKSPARAATEEEKEKQRQRRTRPRDWSEVIGAAALVGFPPDVIARATQRCANLFGEEMSLRSLAESPYSENGRDILTHYGPQSLSSFNGEASIDISENEDSHDLPSDSATEGKRTVRSKRRTPLGQVPLGQMCFCPISDCLRKARGFNGVGKLKRHLQKGHQIPENELDEYILPSDEEMDGAVHVDGFLKPLKWMGGSRGKYKKKWKGSQDESEKEESDEHEDLTSRVKLRTDEASGSGEGGEDSSDEWSQ